MVVRNDDLRLRILQYYSLATDRARVNDFIAPELQRYHQALENPNVFVTLDERPAPYVAVRVTDAEHSQVDSEHSLGPVIRFLTGFPPRYIVRLDPA